MRKIIYNTAIICAISGVFLTSCSKDFTETKFYQEEQAQPLTTVEQLTSFVNGAYVKMRSTNYLGSRYRAYAEVRSDEAYNTLQTDRFTETTSYTLTSTKGDPETTWKAIYETVGNANIVINAPDDLTWGRSNNATAVANEIKRLKGQAYAVRALAFFDLLRLYGQKYSGGDLGVVLPLEFNPNANQARANISETENQIESDFQAALDNLGTTSNVSDRTQISSWAVKALMSRYYLYKGDNAKVAELVKEIVDSGNYTVVPQGDLEVSFSKENAVNSIFEIKLGLNGALGTTSYEYVMNSNGYAQIAVLENVIASYDASDARKGLIVDGFLDKKFPSLKGDTNIKVVRYEEVLLNGAEALVSSNNAKALEYYNLIRQNRGLAAASSVTLDDIKNERKLELLGEGFRYWDLLRWGETIPYYDSDGKADTSKNKTVGDNLLAFPIPAKETDAPGSLVVSNPGYDN